MALINSSLSRAALQTCKETHASLQDLNLDPNSPFYLATESSQWFENTIFPVRGIAIVVHGLNNRPSKMNDLVQSLQTQGLRVLRVSLSGHRGNAQEMESASSEIWLREVFLSYCLAKAAAGNLPVYFIGFSLGALGGETLLNLDLKEKINFKKVILFSPAIVTKGSMSLVKALYPLGDRFEIPSKTPGDYKINTHTAIAAYRALFALKESLHATKMEGSNQPTLVFVDPKDELVDAKGLQRISKENELASWRIERVSNQASTLKRSYHHLIISEEAVGAEEWARMQKTIFEFLNQP